MSVLNSKFFSSHLAGVVFTLLSALFWGLSATCGQYLFEEKDIKPEWLVVVRLLCSGLFLLLVAFVREKKDIFLIFTNKKDTITLIFYAIFGLFLCQYTYYLAINLSNAAIATILQYTSPIFIIIYMTIITKSTPSFKEILALLLVISGVFTLATHGDIKTLVIPTKAIIVGLISALCILVYSITPLKINKRYGITTCLAWGLMLSGVMAFFINKFWLYSGVNDFMGVLAILGVVFGGTILSFSFYMIGLSILGPTKTSLIAAVEPVAAAVFVAVLLGVKFVFLDIVGFALILSATVILSKK